MRQYQILAQKRKKKQTIMAGVFLFILIGGWFWPLLGYSVPLCMLLGIGIGIFRGRKWCDWYCPRGSFFDTLIKPVSPKKKIPGFFQKKSFRLSIFIFLSLVLISNILSRWPDPYKVGEFFLILLTITTVFGVICGLIFHQRSWCYFCPVGLLASWIGAKREPLEKIFRLCTDCQLCSRACPMQIAPSQSNDCLKCNLCILVCPPNALTR